jgi:hypothetical protein
MPENTQAQGSELSDQLGADPDLSKCPVCGGPADNGHDRCLPPNPYLCTKCAERREEEEATLYDNMLSLDGPL